MSAAATARQCDDAGYEHLSGGLMHRVSRINRQSWSRYGTNNTARQYDHDVRVKV